MRRGHDTRADWHLTGPDAGHQQEADGPRPSDGCREGERATPSIEATAHCAYCGRRVPPDADALERFGERFCSLAHADEFVAGVRARRMEAAAGSARETSTRADHAGACARLPAGQQGWRDSLKRGACWAAPLLLLLAVPLVWSGGSAAAGGTLLTAIAFLACPLGMYFMMRAMRNIHHQGGPEVQRDMPDKGDRRA